jgi:hypothetical protein
MVSARIGAGRDPETGLFRRAERAERSGEFLGVSDDDFTAEGQGAAGKI